MAQAQSAEEKARLKKQWTDLAIKQAGNSQWDEAVLTNKSILQLFPGEIEAYNRLGKAYSELGRYAEAREAYSQTLIYNPKNTIAKKKPGSTGAVTRKCGPGSHRSRAHRSPTLY